MKTTFKAWNNFEMTFGYSHSFEMFGFTWAIHHPRYETRYCVSEITTGLRLWAATFKTIRGAEADARKYLATKGNAEVKRCVAKGRRQMAQLRGKLRRAKVNA